MRRLAAAALVAAALALVGVLVLAGRDGADLAIADGDQLAVIDASGTRLLADVPVGASPSAVVAGAGALWIANADGGSVTRVDRRTRRVSDTIPVGGGPSALAVGAGGVWVANALDGTVSWIAPATNTVVATIPVGNGPTGVCVTGGAVWVAVSYDRRLLRIDPASRRTTSTGLADRPTELACGGDAVWATSESAGSLTQVGAADGRVRRRVLSGAGASGIAWGAGAVWVANTRDGTVARFDPRRGARTAVVALARGARPRRLAVGGGGVWVSDEDAGTVTRVDPRRATVGRRLAIGQRPQGLTVVDGALWLGVRGSGAAHRGGTLRVLRPRETGALAAVDLDPAIGYAPEAAQVLGLTNDGLVAFARAGGRHGATLIPDLAVALPSPTDHGRRYAFRLRPGVRYSTGAPVRAGDVRRGLERALAHDIVPATMYTTIRGAAACRPGVPCDLSAGILVDDRAGTIAFRLTRADPDFLYKLAMPFAMAVPAGTPPRATATPRPATGPYRIASFRRGSVRLVRNPRFRPIPGRPDGYPDAIVLAHGTPLRDALRDVEAGRADVLGGTVLNGLPKPDLDLLTTRYAGRLHVNVQPLTFLLELNDARPPFDRRDARRALSFAIDRRASVAVQGGPRFARATCQGLPPGFPGYRPYCPYTADPGPGRPWSAPDLARARRLVRRSGTAGMRVEVLSPYTGYFAVQARQARATLARIGYRARIRTMGINAMFAYALRPRTPAQVWPVWWQADYPSASGFLEGLFSCSSSRTPCDPTVTALVDRARDAQAAGRTSDVAWARVDRRLTDLAGVVPLTNLQWSDVLSDRVGNYQSSLQGGVLLDQLWVR